MTLRRQLPACLALLLAAPLPALAQARRAQAARVDALFARWDRGDSPGCALGVFQDGRILFSRGYGMADLELGAAITPQSVFDIASASKQFTAMCILLLAKEGKLSLEDDLRRHLPEIPDFGKRITLRHLLHHTSGIRDYIEALLLAGAKVGDVTTEADALRAICRQRTLNFAPGDQYLYSNSGYFLLSLVVTRASGKPLAEFAQERIFGPLGMRHTRFNDPRAPSPAGRASGYAPAAKGGFTLAASNWEQVGDGGVQTSIEDLFLWDRNFSDPRVGGAGLLKEMQTPGRLNSGRPLEYAAGLLVNRIRGLKAVGHAGVTVGFRSALVRFPDTGLSVVCLANVESLDPGELAVKVAEVFLGGAMQPLPPASRAGEGPAAAFTEAEVSRWLGLYQNPSHGRLWTVTLAEGRLLLDVAGTSFRLIRTARDGFRTEGGPVAITLEFLPAAAGGRPRLQARVGDSREPRRYEPVERWRPTPEQLQGLSGDYHSEELDTVYSLRPASGRLLLTHRSVGLKALQPTLLDRFTLGATEFHFQRDPEGTVTGFNLGSDRSKHLWFQRVRPAKPGPGQAGS